MTLSFGKIVQTTLDLEGDYSDNPNDSGGKTRYGITEQVARAHGYTGEMQALPLAIAISIYRSDYWDAMRLDNVAQLSEALAAKLFDMGVNCGVGFAGRCLQRALNLLNRQETDFSDIVVDSRVGTVTLAAMTVLFQKRGKDAEVVLLEMLRCLQGERYILLAESQKKNETFIFGWFRNRVTF